jgi:hypothetical protein
MKPTRAALAIVMAVLVSGSAFADGRKPTADEQTEGALKAAGFTTWSKIELDDDGYWDVDDAVGVDGKRYDVDLAVTDLKVLKKEPDTD